MISSIQLRCVVFALASLMILSTAAPKVQATDGVGFSLSDASVSKGRLFEVTLSVSGEDTVASFVAELEFNADRIQYRSASVRDSDAEYSVNTTEHGKITLVYLDEDGISCAETTPLVTFEFKGAKAGESEISLAVRDLIDEDAADVPMSFCDGATVSVEVSPKNSSDRSHKNKKGTAEEIEEYDTGEEISRSNPLGAKRLFDSSEDTAVIVAVSLASVASLCAVAFLAYKLGLRNQRIKDKPDIPLEKSESGKKGKGEVKR